MAWGQANIERWMILGSRVLDVGSRDINGSYREIVSQYQPLEYIGIDSIDGPGVDKVMSLVDAVRKYGPESFDVIICTEVLEHIEQWRESVWMLKLLCRFGGIIILTTRSPGFKRHDYPSDYWRFESRHLEDAFSDCDIIASKNDSKDQGTYIIVQRGKDAIFPSKKIKAIEAPAA